MELSFLIAQNMDAGEAAGGLGIAIFVAIILFGLFALWLWALIHAIKNPSLDSTTRLIWVLVILFTNPIGPILYLLMGRGSSSAT